MKSLFIIRHAKSSWDLSTPNDFDRTLNDRGKKNAPEMAKRLLEKNIKIDLFVSSPAKRAKKTAELFIKEFKRKEGEILFIPGLYHAPVAVFMDVIRELDNALDNVAIFSHNPGITEFINKLTEVKIDNMPTCGVFAISVDVTNWKDFITAKKEFLFFDYPKNGFYD